MATTESGYREALRDFLKTEACPHVDELERTQAFPHEIFQKLGRYEFFAQCFRSGDRLVLGARLLDIRVFKILIEELAKTRCFGLTLTVSMHVGVFLPLILRLAAPEIRDGIVPNALAGGCLGTIAATESYVSGSDFMGMECAADISPDQITLNGHKHYITNAAVADYVVVFARSRPGRHFSNFSALLTPTGLPGISRSRLPMAVFKTAVISHIEFADVTLPPSHLLGRTGLGMRYFLEHIAIERLSGGIWAVAAADECIREAQCAAMGRLVGNETLWDKSSVRHRIAQAIVQLRLLRGLVEQVVEDLDCTGRLDPLDSAVIKAAIAPAMESIIGTCLQLQGAKGLEAESPLLRLLNDFRTFGIAGGSTETMLDIIADLSSS